MPRTPVKRPARRVVPAGYPRFLTVLKDHIRQAQVKAALSVNSELIKLYWHIGREILLRQRKEGWGSKVVDRLGADLLAEFPEMTGLSPRNLLYMRAFADAYPDPSIVQQVAAQLPWAHNLVLLDKVKRTEDRLWYAAAAVRHVWSRSVLSLQIAARAHKRHGKAITNFQRTLPPGRSDLVQQTLKDPYTFDFLTLAVNARERELEQGLVEHVQKFLIELGVGFAFLGRQFHMEVEGEDYYMDLLFYHVRLRCYVVIDLKMGAFKPEYVGKMGFYLSAVDAELRHADDQPTIGLLLCKGAKKLTVEYALRGTNKPIGVSQWSTRLVAELPRKLQRLLPTAAQIEKELEKKPGKRRRG
jgi:predicted nuclease of restriction endonuclease-like (RecB) superfamily